MRRNGTLPFGALLDALIDGASEWSRFPPAPLDAGRVAAQLALCDAAALVKLGRHLEKVRRVLDDLDLTERAYYVERASMAAERILPLAEVQPPAPYFSMVIVHKRGAAWR